MFKFMLVVVFGPIIMTTTSGTSSSLATWSQPSNIENPIRIPMVDFDSCSRARKLAEKIPNTLAVTCDAIKDGE